MYVQLNVTVCADPDSADEELVEVVEFVVVDELVVELEAVISTSTLDKYHHNASMPSAMKYNS